jgi:hypothetical protein
MLVSAVAACADIVGFEIAPHRSSHASECAGMLRHGGPSDSGLVSHHTMPQTVHRRNQRRGDLVPLTSTAPHRARTARPS